MENELERKQPGELSEEELKNIAGGDCHKGDKTVVSALNWCDYYKIRGSKGDSFCGTCVYCSYEKGLWLCDRENMMKKEKEQKKKN